MYSQEDGLNISAPKNGSYMSGCRETALFCHDLIFILNSLSSCVYMCVYDVHVGTGEGEESSGPPPPPADTPNTGGQLPM